MMIGALLVRTRIPRFFAAVSRKDLDATSRDLADEMVFEFPGQSTISGKYEGPERFRAFWKRIFERYETFRLTPKRIALNRPYTLGLTNTALVEWVAVAVTHDGLTMHAEGVAVVELRRGKLVHARDYFFDPSVLDAVWGRRPEGRETPESMRMVAPPRS